MRQAYISLATRAKHILLALAVFSLTACAQRNACPKVPEDAVRELCQYMVNVYPEATLQDIYKTCYQDFFGPGHLVTDSASALNYIQSEVEEIKASEQEQIHQAKDEPTGFRHRFVRIDLHRIVRGEMSEEELLDRFITAANTAKPVHDDWAGEWAQIETIALQVHPQWQNEEIQTALREAAQLNRAVRHSDAFRETYHPHYRIVPNE